MSVSNHQRLDCLFSSLFRRRSMKRSKLCVNGLCEENSPVTGEFPTQSATNTENVFIWWRHHKSGQPVWPLTTTTFPRERQPVKRCLSTCWLSGKLWYLKHSCVGDAIIYQQFCLYFWNHFTVYPVTIVTVKSKIAAANMNTQMCLVSLRWRHNDQT